jgi:hypothetical protein
MYPDWRVAVRAKERRARVGVTEGHSALLK